VPWLPELFSGPALERILTLPIGRVVGPADVAALAVHLMTNTALTGATYDIDGGQQFVA
jgi:NAD(P)-dependent dehydrogenase (short-subunit alcohol dehydrogenase family)